MEIAIASWPEGHRLVELANQGGGCGDFTVIAVRCISFRFRSEERRSHQ